MNSQSVTDKARSLEANVVASVTNAAELVKHTERVCKFAIRDLADLLELVKAASPLEHALVDAFRELRSAVLAELGPSADVAAIEMRLVSLVRAELEPARFSTLVRELVSEIQKRHSDLVPKPAAAPDAAAPEPAPGAEAPWEYVYDANGVATGTRPLVAPVDPPAPQTAPDAPTAVDTAPAVEPVETPADTPPAPLETTPDAPPAETAT